MDEAEPHDTVIWGLTRAGRTFRPSDWCERLAGLAAAFHLNERGSYSSLVLPVSVRGTNALVVSRDLATTEPRLLRFLIGFAQDNELITTESADAISSPQMLEPPQAACPPRQAGEPQEPV
ncbi:MAG: DUF3579 domain-containing protein [Pseudomonadota bacterium]|nr:DUF3579 domain-containing protein [Pseudomonadota bacterium]